MPGRRTPAPSLPLLSLLALGCSSAEPDSAAGPSSAAVAAASPEATDAGMRILAAGGNAVDAAIAVSLALGVSEPAGSGIGGQTFFLLHRPGQGALVIHGSTLAPSFLPEEVRAEDISGRRATTVPSTLRVLDRAHAEFGSGRLSWAQLMAPAIELAEEGVVPGAFRRASMLRYVDALAADPGSARVFLNGEDEVPPAGSKFTRPLLAKTLRRLAAAGAEDFYRGAIAGEIVADMQRGGGYLQAEDLANFPEARLTPALSGSYRGWQVHTLPPPAGGWVVLLALNILEESSSQELRAEDSRVIHMAEALQLAHGMRVDAALFPDAEDDAALRRRTDKATAAEIRRRGDGETTHFCVVDQDGLMVSVTQSLNSYFGAKVMHPELGFLYNDYMREFELNDPEHPYALEAGAMPYSSMSATILSRDGRAELGLGSPGSRRIISAVIQVISNWVDAGMAIDAAVAAPRMHVVPENRHLLFEQEVPEAVLLRQLEESGFRVFKPFTSFDRGGLSPYFGGVHALGRRAPGNWQAAADPRRDGYGARTNNNRFRRASCWVSGPDWVCCYLSWLRTRAWSIT